MASFIDFKLSPEILKSLERMNFKEPSPIQVEAIPLIQGGHDVIALAETGSGKTAACAIPVCDRVDVNRTSVQALIVVPTRELALQYATEAQKIGKDKNVKIFAIYGGEDASMQLSKLKHGVQVLVATPGRLIDFIYSRQVDLQHVETLILDEADEMLSMGFYEDLNFIIDCLVHKHQTLLFSATMPKQIKDLAKKHMKDPLEVVLTGTQVSPKSIEHLFAYCHHEAREHRLEELIDQVKPHQSIVFCQSRVQVEKVCRRLQKRFGTVDFLHAGLGQDMRTAITNKFRSGRIQTLVATDVASRGLDFSGVSHVFIFQLAEDLDVYVHRAGRTGRNDRKGVVISLVTKRELRLVEQLGKKIGTEPKWLGEAPSPDQGHSNPVHRSIPPRRRRPPQRSTGSK